jgi:hypothetical protein
MTAGVAGGVAGAVVVKLVFRRGFSCSSFGGEYERFTNCGGGGNRESEKVEAVVCAPVECALSADDVGAAYKGAIGVTDARGGRT